MPDEHLLPLPVRLLLDAEDAILATAEAIPAPGREGHLGPLSAPGGVMAHVAGTQDLWISGPIAAQPNLARRTQPDDTAYREGIDAFRETIARTRAYVSVLDRDALTDLALLDGSPYANQGLTKGYLVRRSIAHIYLHAGDLTVAGSLVGMADAALPGPLARCQHIDAADTSTTSLVPMLLDGLDEVRRMADGLPVPAQIGAFARLNAGSFIVAHVANREDLLWNAVVRGTPRDTWLEGANVGRGAPRSVPLWDEARASLDRTIEAITPIVESLTPADLTRIVEWNGVPGPLGAQLARSAAHVFYHAGELQALGSLAGMPSLSLPGLLARSARV